MKIVKFWFPVIAWAALIFYFSSIPNLKTDLEYDFILRKIAHVLEYLILTFLLYRAFKGSFNINPLRLFVYPAALAFLYIISDEFHQLFVEGRVASFQDILIDTIGIFGFYLLLIISKKTSKNNRFFKKKQLKSVSLSPSLVNNRSELIN